MNENNNGRGLFYGVIGVATLIVAIIGATFAYFTVNATVTGNANVTGNVAEIDSERVAAVVTKMTATEGKLVPLGSAIIAPGEGTIGATDQRSDALTAADMCFDTKGNKVCDVYKIVLTNSSEASINLEGTLTITPDQVKNSQNFKWSFYKDTNDAAFAANTLASATVNPVSTTTLETNHTLAPNDGKVTYYVMVWLNDTGAPQNEDQAASYTGAVQFTTASNAVIRAEF